MKKLLMALGALALAATLGYSVGRRAPQPTLGTAWAQRYFRDPVAAGKVMIGGVELKGVVGIEGLEESCTVEEIIDPDTGEVRKFRGPLKFNNISVLFDDNKVDEDLMGAWFQKSVVGGALEKKSGSVIIYNRETGEDLLRYEFSGAWPCKWYVPDYDNDQSGMAIEKIEIAVEQLKRG